ncbi:hypothetical protein tb265_29910 [Gemmatimonadetes bacterium T265]|nr:hypothetical protein tb265_29910 [Gemmatimonadetes bacterium T265]
MAHPLSARPTFPRPVTRAVTRVRTAGFTAAAGILAACTASKPAPAAGDSAQTAAAPMAGATAPGAVAPGTDSAGRASTTPATPDADMKAVLDQLASMGGKPIETLTPIQARQQPTPAAAAGIVAAKAGKDTTPTALVPGVASTDRTIAGAAGQIPARIYTPSGAGPFPVVVYYHGGGWVIANKQVYDGGARALSQAAHAVVVSIDYRLAPEHKFPAQHDDALAAYRWALANAASLKGDPKRVGLAGESAGGNLAVATAMGAREAKLQQPTAVLSVYPIAQVDTTTGSYTTYATAKPLSRAMMAWFFKQTVTSPADLKDPRLDLVHANLAGLPPVTIVNAEIDPLQDDGAQLEQALKAAHVPVERRLYRGVTHEFFGMGAAVAKAKDAEQYAGGRLKAAFGG